MSLNIYQPYSVFNEQQISNIEKIKNAKFVFESALKNKGVWTDVVGAVFYQDIPHEQGSNWFALFYDYSGMLKVCDAKVCTEPFQAVYQESTNTILYSRTRHDYRTGLGTFVDGGRDYLRWSPTNSLRAVDVKVEKDKLVIFDNLSLWEGKID